MVPTYEVRRERSEDERSLWEIIAEVWDEDEPDS